MPVDVFNPEQCDAARRAGALPKPTHHPDYVEESPRGRSVLDPTFEVDPLGARGLRHPAPTPPSEKDVVRSKLNQMCLQMEQLKTQEVLLQADIDSAAKQLAAMK